MDLETRHLSQLLTEAQQLPEVLLLKQSTTSTNDEVRALIKKGVQGILDAVRLKLRDVDNINDNGFPQSGIFI